MALEGGDGEASRFDAGQYGFFANTASSDAPLEPLSLGQEDDEDDEDTLLEQGLGHDSNEEVFIPPGDHAHMLLPEHEESQPNAQTQPTQAMASVSPIPTPPPQLSNDPSDQRSHTSGKPRGTAAGRQRRKNDTTSKGKYTISLSPSIALQQQQQQQQHSRNDQSREQKRIAGEWMTSDEVGRLLKIQHAATHPPGFSPYEYDYYAQALASKRRGGRHPASGSGEELFRPPPMYSNAGASADGSDNDGSEDESKERPRNGDAANANANHPKSTKSDGGEDTDERNQSKDGGNAARREYAPLNALGKVPLSNLRAPKPCVDIDIASTGGAGDTGRELSHEPGVAARLLIEQAESYVLAADDAARALGAPRAGDPPAKELDQRRAALLKGATSLLNLSTSPVPSSPSADAVVSHVLNLLKGRSLASRLLSRPVPLDALGPMAWAIARQQTALIEDESLSHSLASALARPECDSDPPTIVGTCVALARCTSLEQLSKGAAISAVTRASMLAHKGNLTSESTRALSEAAIGIVELVLARPASACPPELARALDGVVPSECAQRLRDHFVPQESSQSAHAFVAANAHSAATQGRLQQQRVPTQQPVSAYQQQQAPMIQAAQPGVQSQPQPQPQPQPHPPPPQSAIQERQQQQASLVTEQRPQQQPAQAMPAQAPQEARAAMVQRRVDERGPPPGYEVPLQQQQQQQVMRQRPPAQPGPGPGVQQRTAAPVSNEALFGFEQQQGYRGTR
jgi:hypothetical protein